MSNYWLTYKAIKYLPVGTVLKDMFESDYLIVGFAKNVHDVRLGTEKLLSYPKTREYTYILEHVSEDYQKYFRNLGDLVGLDIASVPNLGGIALQELLKE